MESMTGYAYTENSTEQFSFSIEIKSLNSRYFESYINIPKILRQEESDLAALLREHIRRGKVEMSLDIYDWADTRPVAINANLIKKYYKELQKINDSLMIRDPLNFEAVLNLDGIMTRERSVLTEKSRTDIFRSVEMTIKKAIEMRKKEGAAIKKDLTLCLNEMAEGANLVKNAAKNNVIEKKDLLQKRLEAVLGGRLDDTRLLTEVSILADRLDINEELVRLGDHIKKFKATMKEKDQTGKKLDFIAQEMFREINTVASKSNSSEISHIVVDMKNHIEKIREHCRNLA